MLDCSENNGVRIVSGAVKLGKIGLHVGDEALHLCPPDGDVAGEPVFLWQGHDFGGIDVLVGDANQCYLQALLPWIVCKLKGRKQRLGSRIDRELIRFVNHDGHCRIIAI